MVLDRVESFEKVTIQIPKELKSEVKELKEILNISMNSIYQNAIDEFVKKQKRKRLKREALAMLDEYKTDPELKELSDFSEEIYEY